MAKGGKVGGGKGLGIVGGSGGAGKGGGGKGKNGGVCAPGEVSICVTKEVQTAVIAAFNTAIESSGPIDACTAGLMRVCLDLTTAQDLLSMVAIGLNLGVTKKKKGKGGSTVRLLAKSKGKKSA